MMDPIEWIKDVMNSDTLLDTSQRENGQAILRAAEVKRMESLTDEQLADELTRDEPNPLAVREAGRRLTTPKHPTFQDIFNGQVRPGVPDGFHLTTGPGLPPEGIPCGCIYGQDHDERFFEVLPGGAPRETPEQTTEKE